MVKLLLLFKLQDTIGEEENGQFPPLQKGAVWVKLSLIKYSDRSQPDNPTDTELHSSFLITRLGFLSFLISYREIFHFLHR